jgi:DinB family protein
MKRSLCLMSGVLLVAASATAQPPAPAPVGLAQGMQTAYNNMKQNLTEAAAKMPEADYGSKPSTMPEVRTYGMLFAHVAQAQFGQCSALAGTANPSQGKQLEQELKAKAELVKALADSFAICDKAMSALTDQNATEPVMQGRGQIARGALVANMIAHGNEMYGTAGVYLRAKNIVPPSTERQPMRGGGGGRGRGQQQ